MDNSIWIAIFYSSLILIGGYVSWSFKSYLTEKFKNIATSQDIAQITRQVEQIKSKLNVITNKHHVLFQEEKEALYLFYSTFGVWYMDLEFSVHDYDHRNYSKLWDLDKELDKGLKQTKINAIKIVLFVGNTDMVDITKKIIETTSELQDTVTGAAIDLYFLLEEEAEILHEHKFKGMDIYDELALIKKHLPANADKKKELTDKLKKETTDIYKKIDTLEESFTEIGKRYIRQDLDN
jgi:hypothetical protein